MTRAELESRKAQLENRFSGIYEKRRIGNYTCFVRHDGVLFTLDVIVPFGALVIGYAENEEEAKQNRFEDGDLFFMDELDEEAMFRAMLREIEDHDESKSDDGNC